MPKLKKVELIKKLIEIGFDIDDTMDYNYLYKLYKQSKDISSINSVYTYKPSKGEELIMDKPSEQLKII